MKKKNGRTTTKRREKKSEGKCRFFFKTEQQHINEIKSIQYACVCQVPSEKSNIDFVNRTNTCEHKYLQVIQHEERKCSIPSSVVIIIDESLEKKNQLIDIELCLYFCCFDVTSFDDLKIDCRLIVIEFDH